MKHRAFSVVFSVGAAATSLQSWLIPNWRLLLLAQAVVVIVYIPILRFLPESNQWLSTKDDENQALSSISSDEVFDERQKSENQIKEIVSNRLTLRIMLTGVILYISNSVCYFGLTQNASGLPGNLYVNNVLNCVAEGLGKWLKLFQHRNLTLVVHVCTFCSGIYKPL